MRLRAMWRWLGVLSLAVPVGVLSQVTAPSSEAATSLTAADIQRLEQNPNQRVVVIMQNQHTDLAGQSNTGIRASAIQADQASVVRELQAVRAPRVQPFHLINAIGATVSEAEVQHLRSDPGVRAVVPDSVVPRPTFQQNLTSSPGGSASGGTVAQACSTNGQPLLEPEALQVTNTAGTTLSAQNLKTPSGQPINGSGVKVAYIADTIDPNNQDFIRPDGSHVIVDYQDFNGDGFFDGDGGAEAFGDASSIAAQGRFTYDASAYADPAQSVSIQHPCPIRVLGMAPGASIIALKVFGALPAFDSDFVLAIQYAADHGANVLNESFGNNPQPALDNVDPWSLANDAAVADGVTVTVSTGDAGTAGTLGTPSTNPDVISVGATSTLRLFEQTGYPGTGLGTGWVNNKLATLSSAGVAQNGQQTVDVVAPGIDGWALCSTNLKLFPECTSFGGAASPIQDFGGTSESAPLTAGEAALVIQAYRATHGNVSPTPAVVKQIIQSTATNLDYPGYEQGAGLINSYQAVQAAMSMHDASGSPAAQGDQLLITTHPNSPALDQTLSVQGNPGTQQTVPVQVTNNGTHGQIIAPQIRMLSKSATQHFLVNLDPAADTPFLDAFGRPSFKTTQTFTVGSGQQYLQVAEAWNTVNNPASDARITLYEPDGKIVLYSNAQGAGSGYTSLEVSDPQPGTWTAVVWAVKGQYSGPVHMDVTTGTYTSTGTVQPSYTTIQPGQTATFQVHVTLPSQPGDSTADLVLRTVFRSDILATVPIVTRTLVPTSATGGSWSGTLTGGNGRPITGPEQTFTFNVPAGLRDLDLGISLPNTGYNLFAALVAPNGIPVDYQSNVKGYDQNGNPTGYNNALQFFQDNPTPGQWRLMFELNFTSPGFTTQEPFTGTITFNGASVSATGVPTSSTTTLAAGQSTTVTVNVKNTGLVPEYYFADPRLTSQTLYVTGGETDASLPAAAIAFVVPPQTSTAIGFTQANVPFMMEIGNNTFTPPVGYGNDPAVTTASTKGADGTYSALAEYSNAPEVNPGFWYTAASPVGPFGPSGAPSGTASEILGAVVTRAFDGNASSSTGDYWSFETGVSSTAPDFLYLAPGQSGKLMVTFTASASAPPGSVVQGTLYLDTIGIAPPFLATGSGDEVAAIPYSYTVKK